MQTKLKNKKEIDVNNNSLENKNFRNNQNYIIDKQKNIVISNFIWFRNLSILNHFLDNNLIGIFISIIYFFFISFYFFSLFSSFLYVFFIDLIFFLIIILFIKSTNKNIFNGEFKYPILNSNSYLFSDNNKDDKLVLSAIYIVSYLPFLFSYIGYLLLDISGAIVFFILGIMFIASKKFKKIGAYFLRLRLINILLFPLFLLYYLAINIGYKKNYLVYVKNPSFKIFSGFKNLSNYSAENEEILVIKK